MMPFGDGGLLLLFVVDLPVLAGLLIVGTWVTVVLQKMVAKRFELGPLGSRAVYLVNVVTSPALLLLWWVALLGMEGVGLPMRLTMLVASQVGVIWIHRLLYVRALGIGTTDERGWLRFAAAANAVSAAPGFVTFALLASRQTRTVLLNVLGSIVESPLAVALRLLDGPAWLLDALAHSVRAALRGVFG